VARGRRPGARRRRPGADPGDRPRPHGAVRGRTVKGGLTELGAPGAPAGTRMSPSTTTMGKQGGIPEKWAPGGTLAV